MRRFIALQPIKLGLGDFALRDCSGPVLVEIAAGADLVVDLVEHFQPAGGGEGVGPEGVDDEVPGGQVLWFGAWREAMVCGDGGHFEGWVWICEREVEYDATIRRQAVL